jgi:hypothetical protein
MSWLSELDWPTLLLALAILSHGLITTRKTKDMAGEMAAMAAKVDAAVALVAAIEAKIQALHDATASSIDPAAVQALADHMQTAVLDPLNAIVAEPAPAVGSVTSGGAA